MKVNGPCFPLFADFAPFFRHLGHPGLCQMFCGLVGATWGLTLPTLHTPRPYFPLDTISLTLTREAFEALGHRDGERRNLGLLYLPPEGARGGRGGRGTEPDPTGLCGVIAEISSLHRGWRLVDERYLKPLFGGQMMPGSDSVPHRAPLRRPGAGVNGD